MAKRDESLIDSRNRNESVKVDCPSCGSNGVVQFHTIERVPVHSVMNIATRQDALEFPRGSIRLGFCKACGFISNMAFDSALMAYSSDCEESQGYSPTFNTFAHKLAEDMVRKYSLINKRILEIGCGKGEFLKLICQLGQNSGIGFDPAYVEGRGKGVAEEQVTFIKDYYSEKYTNYKADAIFCRMTLEHVPETARMIRTVRSAIGENEGTLVFFQVPDVTRILQACAFEDIYYEHCSYFSPGSLSQLFLQNGFEVLDVRKDYDGQYIMLEAMPVEGEPGAKRNFEDDLCELSRCVERFPQQYEEKMQRWASVFRGFQDGDHKVVLWGSGSKGVAFLTALGIGSEVEFVVDINPHRQGTFMAGTGQKVVAPEFLLEYLPDVVIVMNSIYLDEIKGDLDRLGLKPVVMAL